MSADALFDAADYGEGKVSRKRGKNTTQPRAQTNATQDGSWFALGRMGRTPSGALHRSRIATPDDVARLGYNPHVASTGFVITICGLGGYAITLDREMPNGHKILACAECMTGVPKVLRFEGEEGEGSSGVRPSRAH